jgi:hypothetical protein
MGAIFLRSPFFSKLSEAFRGEIEVGINVYVFERTFHKRVGFTYKQFPTCSRTRDAENTQTLCSLDLRAPPFLHQACVGVYGGRYPAFSLFD